ncbi:sensor domain-containing protein [Hydrogenimonas thermophila]|uniref:PAS domain S-box-containing protein/diguanylate cyclase (GGDEF) domain-containing protein n=1 Tax=Hydrogenimonas thermophila TaxID=223786 RepID=A0A1I5LXS0_9BACT|nr:EAL domain-containing protein [Hydrogenimonas thermophila]SFP01561.1 PAS domain S-box-containing protein/diguanylate cyclase (GGDEF) domain-containing protein [Hydrogenimonas thermophila]
MKSNKMIENIKFLRLLADNLPDMLWAKDTEGRYLFANKALCENLLMAKDTEEPIGKTDVFFAKREREKHPDNPEWHTFGELCFNSDVVTLEHMKPMRFEEFGNVKGKMLYLEVHKAPLFDDEGNLLGTVGSGRDITRQKELENQIKKSKETFEQLLNTTIEGLFVFDVNKRCILANEMASHITGYSIEELIGMHAINDIIDPSVRDYVTQKMKIDNADPYEMAIKHKNGKKIPVLARGKNIDLFGEKVRVSAILDISDIKKAQKKIEYLAYYDTLTGLPNRSLLNNYMEQIMIASNENGFDNALVFIDMDNFKKINDTAGHKSGDILLQEIALRIKNSITENDIALRFGGDEFIIILTNLKNIDNEIEEKINKIRQNIEKEFFLPEPYMMEIHPEFSMGIIFFKGSKHNPEELLKKADLALYDAKKAGKNCIKYYNHNMQKEIEQQIEIEYRLNKAFENDEIKVFYQPQISLDGKITGAEALCRWQHPVDGIISPIKFIPIAESSGQIIKLGDIVLEKVCQHIHNWSKNSKFKSIPISVNISVKQFMLPEFIESVEEKIKKYNIKKGMLKFELTESLFLNDLKKVVDKMHKLKEMGISISLDDFGTGFSSLVYLKSLPLSQLKIDRSFVTDIANDENDKAIVNATVAIADSMKLQTIAEGVETVEQKEFLKDIGCTVYQGYLFSKPLPLEEFESYIENY